MTKVILREKDYLYVLQERESYQKRDLATFVEEGNYSSHSKPPQENVQRVLQVQGFLGTSDPQEERVVTGRDLRERVHSTGKYPYSIHVKLSKVYPNGQRYSGSGALVGPQHVLTCAHNVFDVGTKSWAQSIEVYPGLNKESAPFGMTRAVRVYAHKKYVNGGNSEYDLALLVLEDSIGIKAGWAGIASSTKDRLLNEVVQITGYPGDKPGCNEMWTMKHQIARVEKRRFDYAIDTFAGQSGGAIWVSQYGQPMIIGVHTLGGVLSNSGVRITPKKYLNFLKPAIEETYHIPGQEPSHANWAMTAVSLCSKLFSLVVSRSQPPAAKSRPQSSVALSRSQPSFDHRLTFVPELAFGKAKWEKYFGDVGVEPPLPNDIAEILKSPCPYWSGKRVEETHMLVLIPQKVNEDPFNLSLLGRLIQSPQGGGYLAKFGEFPIDIKVENQSTSKSYWALMTKDVLPYSRSKAFSEQQALLKRPYAVPGALEIATGILMHHAQTGENLYPGDPNITYTRCSDRAGGRWRVVVGSFGSRVLDLYDRVFDNDTQVGGRTLNTMALGLGGVRKL